MRTFVKGAMERMITAIPLPVYQFLMRMEVIGLFYHVVSNRSLSHVRNLFPYKTPEMFERDLIYLKQHFNPISYEQAFDSLCRNARREPNNVLLTLDDGYAECFTIVRPLLLKHGIPCIFFVTTAFIDNKRMFYRNKVSLCIERVSTFGNTELGKFLKQVKANFGQDLRDLKSFLRWIKSLQYEDEETIEGVCGILGLDLDEYLAIQRPYLSSGQVRRLVSDGFTIGGHSKNHPRLGRLTDKEIEYELVGSCETVRALTGQERVPFCFPFSGHGVNESLLERLLEQHPFIGLLFDTMGMRKTKAFVMNRVWADQPPPEGANRSNLPTILHAAFRDQWAARLGIDGRLFGGHDWATNSITSVL